MSKRFSGVLVSFEQDMSEERTEEVLSAIRCLRGVLLVEPVEADFNAKIEADRVRMDLWKKIRDIIFPPSGPR